MTRKFVVAILFDDAMERVVLVKRAKPPFQDKYNGPGGEVEAGEMPVLAALREIQEETGLAATDLMPFGNGDELLWLGSLELPLNRKYPEIEGDIDAPPATLHYFAGRMKAGARPRTVESRNQVETLRVSDVVNRTDDEPALAGRGNLEYFIREAMARLAESEAPAKDDPPETLVLFSGGKDSFLTACHYAEKGRRVALFSCNNGSVQAETNLLHGVARLRNRYGKDLVRYAGIYLTVGTIQEMTLRYMQTPLRDIATSYPALVPAQMRCMFCQTSMWIAAMAYAIAKDIHTIAAGYKSQDLFVTGIPEYIDHMRGIADKYGIAVETPVWDMPEDYNRDMAMIRKFFEPQVLEPKCVLGLPVNPPDKNEIGDMMAYFENEVLPGIPDMVMHLVPIFKCIRLSEHACEHIEYPLPEPNCGVF